MKSLIEKFGKLGVEHAPGQEVRQQTEGFTMRGGKIEGRPVDFSHGDVDAFTPIPGALEEFIEGVHRGGCQAYTEYRGSLPIREYIAAKLSEFSGSSIAVDQELLITPGTQSALFLAMGASIMPGDKVAIVEPDYFANRKLVVFLGGIPVPVSMGYKGGKDGAGLNLSELKAAFQDGVKLFLFSNPNNPTGVIYSEEEIKSIAALAKQYEVSLIVDELYSRQIFGNHPYTHLCAQREKPENLITIMGPSKTESLSGYRLGVAYGNADMITRMEKLQAIVCLRAPGYNQAALKTWFSEPEGWMEERIKAHEAIRDDIVARLRTVEGVQVRPTEAGSYLFPSIPKLDISVSDFVKCLRLQAGVTVTPGTEFGSTCENSFRINFSQDAKTAAEAIDRIIEMIERYRK